MVFIQVYTTEDLDDYTTMKPLIVWLTPLFLGSQVGGCLWRWYITQSFGVVAVS